MPDCDTCSLRSEADSLRLQLSSARATSDSLRLRLAEAVDALRPFAGFACADDGTGPCGCHNCQAKRIVDAAPASPPPAKGEAKCSQ